MHFFQMHFFTFIKTSKPLKSSHAKSFRKFPRKMKKIVYIIISMLFFCAAVSITAQNLECGNLKVTTLPAPGDYGSYGQIAVSRQTVTNPEPGTPAPVSVFLPQTASAANRVPVIFFAHGFGGTNYQFYEALMRQLSSNGYAVIFSPYSSDPLTNHTVRYRQLWRGFQVAVEQFGSLLDTSRVGFAGHSYGAGAVPEMARLAVASGWGANGLFIFSAAPWYSWGTNYEQIPASAKLVVQIYWEDGTNEHLIAQNDVWNRLPQITERRWQVIRSARAVCQLTADHGVTVSGVAPENGEINALDYWGVWRRIHALADYTFTGSAAAKSVAFGDDSRMGKWRTGGVIRPVTPLEATTSPVLNTTTNPTFRWITRCLFAQGSPCQF
jgi:surfactin synthase thioesterase subunit